MTPYEARLLDLALREVLGGESPPDVLGRLARTRRVRRLRLGGLAAAAVLLIAAGAWLLWPETPTIRLDAGEREVAGPALVVTPLARIEVPRHALARIAMDAEGGDLTVEALKGAVRIDGVSLDEGETRTVLGPKEKSMLDELAERGIVEIRDLSTPQAQDHYKAAVATRAQLAAVLAAKPARYGHLRARLQQLSDEPELRRWQLEVLLGDPDSASSGRARGVLRAKPAEASVETALRLAEDGDVVFFRELKRRATASPEFVHTLPAVYHGLRGDRTAVPTLLWFRRSGFVRSQHDLYIAVAAALRETGAPEHWDGAKSFTRREVSRALLREDFSHARRALVRLEYFAPGRTPLLHDLNRRLFEFGRGREAALATAARIEEAAERLR